MLHRSFKPAKCKMSLKLATSRLKLLKNKKEVQLKQMKRELAQLLESGQDQTARIRVEHVVREEKMMAAYELLEIYCELIVARLPIIESQKNCPIDLKEAITSVVFATPRCADIPELQDIRKHFTGKYGKEFISAATELRPQCGVSRMLVEKLSVNAPDGPTKIKILTAIAEEHNIKWDPKSFGETELKPHDDLLKASRMQTEPSYVQAPPTPEQKHNAPVNFDHNVMPSTRSGDFASKDASGAQADMSTRHQPGVRPSGTRSERHSYSGDENSFPSDRKHWNMEFKDATAAAQAAAESAERASMAARAAAELSSRGQYSTESSKSNVPSSRDQGLSKNDHDNTEEDIDKLMKDFLKGARYTQKRSSEEESVKAERSAGVSGNNVVEESSGSDVKFMSSRHEGMQTDNFNYFAEGSIRKQSSSVSSHSHTKGDLYSQKNSEGAIKAETSTEFSGMNMNRQSIGSGAEFLSSGQGDMESNSFNYFAEEGSREKNSSVSIHSHSSSHGDDYDVSPFTQPEYEIDGGKDPFGHEKEHRDTEQRSSYSNTAVVFDEPVSDDDHHNIFDTPNYAVPAFDLYPSSPVRESPRHLPLNSDTWSPRHNMSGAFEKFPSESRVFEQAHSPPKFDESSMKSAKPDEVSPLTFDESEGPSSESEDEVDNSRLDQKTEPSSLPQKESIFLRTPDHSQRESHGSTGSFFTENADSSSNIKEDDELLRHSSLDSGYKLKFGTLTGGFRQKGYIRPPYNKSPSGDASSFKRGAENSVTSIENSPAHPSVKSAKVETKSSSNTPFADSDSDSDESEEELPQRHLSSKREPYSAKSSKEMDSKLSLRDPVMFFDSEDDNSEEDIPKQTVNNTGRVGSGFSRRTKATPSSGRNSHSEATVGSGTSQPNSEANARKTPSRSSYYSESPPNVRSQTGNSVQRESPPEPRAEKQSTSRLKTESSNSRSSCLSETLANPSSQTEYSGNLGSGPPEPRAERQSISKPIPESNSSTRRENRKSSFEPPSNRQGNVQTSANQATSKPRSESSFSTLKENPKSSATEPQSSPVRTVTSGGTESARLSTSSGELPSRESSLKKASHVHPKLPDYDTLAAQFQSLRSNR